MPNNYFQFKQFTIQQDQCAMKVTTDGCLFGGYIAHTIVNCQLTIDNCLDIGTGTGLLSLMFAQKLNTQIDAVEMDPAAYIQAKENFNQSPWNERLHIFNADILQFEANKKYDCIISNPPFFEDDLVSPDSNKNNAKHATALTLKEMIKVINHYLKEDGIFSVLLPYHREAYFEKEAAQLGFYLYEKLNVRQTPTHNFFRSILSFSRKQSSVIINQLTIKGNDGTYTDDFTALLKDYYLYL
jgi:tRNA1Val (adenine37-N6)-methyltransferase